MTVINGVSILESMVLQIIPLWIILCLLGSLRSLSKKKKGSLYKLDTNSNGKVRNLLIPSAFDRMRQEILVLCCFSFFLLQTETVYKVSYHTSSLYNIHHANLYESSMGDVQCHWRFSAIFIKKNIGHNQEFFQKV